MPNKKNQDTVKYVSQKLETASSVTFFEYKNLRSNALNDLRRKVKEIESEVLVAKNTLVKIALGPRKVSGSDLQGQTGLVMSFGDSLKPLKTLFDYAKDHKQIKVKGAVVDNVYYDAQGVQRLSTLPSKDELIAGVLRGFNAPVTGFTVVLNGTRNRFIYALSAVSKKKEVGE